jgi:hypothetical protein
MIEHLTFEPVSTVSIVGDRAFAWCKRLKSVCIPRSVESLSKASFAACSSLLNLTFESDSKLSVVGPFAFQTCQRLPQICLPRSLKTLGQKCFIRCKALSSVTFEAGAALFVIEAGAFGHCEALKAICLPASLQSVTAPFAESGISAIAVDANNAHLSLSKPFLLDFAGSRVIQAYGSLDIVRIPQTVTILGDSAFRGGQSLTAICIPANVETIAAHCFYGSRLASITFEAGSKLTVIEMEAFAHCEALTAFHIPSLLERVNGSAFESSKISDVTVDPMNGHLRFSAPFLMDFEGVCVIRYFGREANVTIPKEIQRLGRCCFQSCSGLRRIFCEANAQLSAIEENAFHGSTLQIIEIPSSVVAIGAKCFSQCERLHLISFAAGSKLSDIGTGVLDEMPEVQRIEIPREILEVCRRGFREELKRGIVTLHGHSSPNDSHFWV